MIIPAYIINLKKRSDRKAHILAPFDNRNEFNINNIEANNQGVEMLSGGITGFNLGVPINRRRVWLTKFYGTQFILLFSGAFNKLLD